VGEDGFALLATVAASHGRAIDQPLPALLNVFAAQLVVAAEDPQHHLAKR
jgi:hypothetical protein